MADLQPWRSGFCGTHIPEGHVSHGQCRGGQTDRKHGYRPCVCSCHHQTPAAEDAPGDLKASGSEPCPSAAGPGRTTIFSAKAAPGAVVLIVDPLTASTLARSLEEAYTAADLPQADRPLWMWDIASLRRAAADAEVEAAATRVDLTLTPQTHLQLVAGGEEVATGPERGSSARSRHTLGGAR